MPSTPTNRRFAVCVGINTYSPESGLADLTAAEDNARQFDALLGDLGFPAEQRCLLTGAQATLAAINAALDEFIIDRPQTDDLVVFYFAGHGVPVNIGSSDQPRSEVFLAPMTLPLS